MTSPMVDTVRSVPLNVDLDQMEAESGFPFDQEDRDDHFRSQLDDIAQRHPEFAQHLEGFPFRPDRRPPRVSDQEFRRFTERPFGSGHFSGFPFSDPFEDTQPEQKKPSQQEEKPKAERSRKQNNIQTSNTVDLGQKQEPVNDRNQRSMSAPPPDNPQRYVSSIHIPINPEGGMGDMGKAQSQPQEKPVNKPTERVIPIHVEGRDEPVIPKHTGPSFTQPQPQPERIFGHSPSQFTQFVGREPQKQQQNFTAKEQERQIPVQKVAPQQQQQSQKQKPEVPQQQPKQKQEVPQQQQQPKQEQPPQPQPPKSNNPIDIIQSIQKDVGELMAQVDKFTGIPKDKHYLYLDEMLTRNLLKLDNIDTQKQENIRQARKEAIKCIESCIEILEAKAAANLLQEQKDTPKPVEIQEKMEVEEKEKMEIDEKEKIEEKPKVEETKVETHNKLEETQPQAEIELVTEQTTTPPPPAQEEKPQTDEEMKDLASEIKEPTTGDDEAAEKKVVNK